MKFPVLYHTVYGHTLQLARAVEEGVKSVAGVEAIFRRAPEFPHVEKELEAKDGYETKIWREQKELAPTAEDLAICRVQGKRVAQLAKKVRG